MGNHSYSGHPSVSGEGSDEAGWTEVGMSLHGPFHLFTGKQYNSLIFSTSVSYSQHSILSI